MPVSVCGLLFLLPRIWALLDRYVVSSALGPKSMYVNTYLDMQVSKHVESKFRLLL